MFQVALCRIDQAVRRNLAPAVLSCFDTLAARVAEVQQALKTFSPQFARSSWGLPAYALPLVAEISARALLKGLIYNMNFRRRRQGGRLL